MFKKAKELKVKNEFPDHLPGETPRERKVIQPFGGKNLP